MLGKIWLLLFLLANNLAIAADNFDVSTNILTAPQVRVADTLYFDVQLKVASIVSIGSAVAAETYDTYNTLNNQLSIPVVTVGSETYHNVIITAGTILKVGASCTIDSTCSKVGTPEVKGILPGDSRISVMFNFMGGKEGIITAAKHIHNGITNKQSINSWHLKIPFLSWLIFQG